MLCISVSWRPEYCSKAASPGLSHRLIREVCLQSHPAGSEGYKGSNSKISTGTGMVGQDCYLFEPEVLLLLKIISYNISLLETFI